MRHRLLVLVSAALVAACASRPVERGAPRRAWLAALAVAEQEAAAGRFTVADSALASYAAAHPTSPDTLEVLFWRALYLVDPANPVDGGPTAALPLIDRYLNALTTPQRHYEAELVRRLAALRTVPPVVRVDTVVRIDTTAVRTTVNREVEARDRARDEELQRLRDSLTRTTAELERIRRRLVPKPP